MWKHKHAFLLILIPPLVILIATNTLFNQIIPTKLVYLPDVTHIGTQARVSILIESLYGWGMSQLLVLGMALVVIIYARHRLADLPPEQRDKGYSAGVALYSIIAVWQLTTLGEFENPLTEDLYEAAFPVRFAQMESDAVTRLVRNFLSAERFLWHAAGVFLFLAAASTIVARETPRKNTMERVDDLRTRQYHLRQILYLGTVFLVAGLIGIKSVLDLPLDQFAAVTKESLAEFDPDASLQKWPIAAAQTLGAGLSLFWSSTITALAITLYVAPAVVQRRQARAIFNDVKAGIGTPLPVKTPPQQFDEWMIDQKLKDSADITGWSSQVIRILTVVSPLIAGSFVDTLKAALS